ncbi:NAD-dependent succinate-semialdehyde dehydrogenase [Vibrio sp.]|nr:NAD-dependent succinate-semialdehyde dehydrogenase [Vibrio sp.]
MFEQTVIMEENIIEPVVGNNLEQHFHVFNPATGRVIGSAPNITSKELDIKIKQAEKAFTVWSKTTVDHRSQILLKWSTLIKKNRDNLSYSLTAEQGKPISESVRELQHACSYIEWFAEEIKRSNGTILPSHDLNTQLQVKQVPVGLGCAITPWNFPAAMVARKVAPALAAGCGVLLKPSEETPLIALALAKLAYQAGIPEALLPVITCTRKDAHWVGKRLTQHASIRKVSFTGSTKVGTQINIQAAAGLKKVSMELGGNAPFIVFEDADIDHAIEQLMKAKFRNAGQVCVAPNRVLVQQSIHDEFIDKLWKKMSELSIGNGIDEVDLGPLINLPAVEKCEKHIHDALQKGAKLYSGGKSMDLGLCFFEPTILTNVTMDMLCANEETFGPIVSILSFEHESSAIEIANNTPYGLAGYFFTDSRQRIRRVSSALEVGMLGENTATLSSVRAPFGGVKASGIGREGGEMGLSEWQETQYHCIYSH